MHLTGVAQAVQVLTGVPYYAKVQARDGLPCPVWKNPTEHGFAQAIQHGATSGLRGLTTATDLYVWQSVNLLHTDFERDAAVTGVRIGLRAGELQINDETVDQPDQFPWIFPYLDAVADMEFDNRRAVVAKWLLINPWLMKLYPEAFEVTWYS